MMSELSDLHLFVSLKIYCFPKMKQNYCGSLKPITIFKIEQNTLGNLVVGIECKTSSVIGMQNHTTSMEHCRIYCKK